MLPTLYQERKLKQSAKQSAQLRGHKLSKFRIAGRNVFEATCVDCGMYVQVNLTPAPNQIDIGGTAVALSCGDLQLPAGVS